MVPLKDSTISTPMAWYMEISREYVVVLNLTAHVIDTLASQI